MVEPGPSILTPFTHWIAKVAACSPCSAFCDDKAVRNGAEKNPAGRPVWLVTLTEGCKTWYSEKIWHVLLQLVYHRLLILKYVVLGWQEKYGCHTVFARIKSQRCSLSSPLHKQHKLTKRRPSFHDPVLLAITFTRHTSMYQFSWWLLDMNSISRTARHLPHVPSSWLLPSPWGRIQLCIHSTACGVSRIGFLNCSKAW